MHLLPRQVLVEANFSVDPSHALLVLHGRSIRVTKRNIHILQSRRKYQLLLQRTCKEE